MVSSKRMQLIITKNLQIQLRQRNNNEKPFKFRYLHSSHYFAYPFRNLSEVTQMNHYMRAAVCISLNNSSMINRNTFAFSPDGNSELLWLVLFQSCALVTNLNERKWSECIPKQTFTNGSNSSSSRMPKTAFQLTEQSLSSRISVRISRWRALMTSYIRKTMNIVIAKKKVLYKIPNIWLSPEFYAGRFFWCILTWLLVQFTLVRTAQLNQLSTSLDKVFQSHNRTGQERRVLTLIGNIYRFNANHAILMSVTIDLACRK